MNTWVRKPRLSPYCGTGGGARSFAKTSTLRTGNDAPNGRRRRDTANLETTELAAQAPGPMASGSSRSGETVEVERGAKSGHEVQGRAGRQSIRLKRRDEDDSGRRLV